MKALIALILITMSLSLQAHEVTLYLIRHAQAQDDGSKNPHLSELGQQQAKHWSQVFSDVSFDAIYSSNYHRTQETAQATATDQKLEVQTYDAKNFDIQNLVQNNDGKTLLIVGHSNTTPDSVNALLNEKKYPWIDHHDHGYLFLIKMFGDKVSVEKLKVFD